MAAISAYGPGVLLAGLLALGGCAGENWPDLSTVQRPAGSDKPADLGAPAAAKAATASAEVEARLKAFDARVNTADQAAAKAYAEYLPRLDKFLAAPPTEDSLTTRWGAAQSALSRVGAAVDDLRAAEEAAANYSIDLSKTAALPAGVAETVASASARYVARRQLLDLESNRLAVLTPASFGAPGPSVVHDSTRTALATITFAGKAPALGDDFAPAIAALRKTVPDVAFDLIASGPTGSLARQQEALRVMMAELQRLKVPASHQTLALATLPDQAVIVRIYVKKP
ncbi:hypothetical protein [Govanella unica]|uniref:Uncharacterized protein n=1 Tax=Govanella unica TaxID=2975056 RepID=A0A9X3TVW0_9PROT|nr:hypothetical protein [Govania unica]MDA5192936.1 hypothetical protein [Govania unica]